MPISLKALEYLTTALLLDLGGAACSVTIISIRHAILTSQQIKM